MNRISKLREKNSIKQIDLAKMLKISQGTLSNWERGIHDPDNETLNKLAKYFDVSTDYLLGNTTDPTPPNKKEPTFEIGSLEWFRAGLVARGIIKEGEDLTNNQLDIALGNLDNLVKMLTNAKN